MGGDHDNQYLICQTSREVQPPPSYSAQPVSEDLTLHRSNTCPVSQSVNEDTVITVIGDAISTAPNSNLRDLLRSGARDGFDSFLSSTQAITGRYVICYSDHERTTIFPDALAHKQLYYHEKDDVATSSPKLYADSVEGSVECSSRVKSALDSDVVSGNESCLVGDKCVVKNLRKILPNHILDFDQKQVSRRPLDFPSVHPNNVPEYIATRIRAAIDGFSSKYDLQMPVTSGWDSRVLLSCARPRLASMDLYVFSHGRDTTTRDISIPHEIASTIGLDFSIYHSKPLKDEFMGEMRRDYIRPRFMGKSRNIQHHFENKSPGSDLNITGNGGEVIRVFYEIPEGLKPVSASRAVDLLGYGGMTFAEEEVNEWISDARPYAEEYDIPMLDLLYWEQRMGNWGARYPYEQDIAIPEVSPFSNYNILLAGLSLPRDSRRPPEYNLSREIVELVWEKLLQFDVNPPESTFQRVKKPLRIRSRRSKAVHKLVDILT